MCLAPIIIKNPYFRSGHIGMNALHNTLDSHMAVPCGNCAQCIAMRQSFYLQRVQMESLRSHLFMFTLTYNDESLIYADVGDYHLAIPFWPDVQNLFKRFRRSGYQFRYSCVSEYGSRRHRPHFHGILALDKSLGNPRLLEQQYSALFRKEWRRNYSNNSFSPDYRPLFTPHYERGRLTTFDFHYIEPVINHDNDCAYYVSKYITKYDSWTKGLLGKIALDPDLEPEEIQYLIKLVKTRSNTSKDFGSWKDPQISAYINKCAARESLFPYPQYYDIYSGKQMPMSPYYGKHCIGFEHLYNRLLASPYSDELATIFDSDSSILDDRISCEHKLRQQSEFNRKLKIIEKRFSE